MNRELHKILGGIDRRESGETKVITLVGGFDKKLNINESRMVVGDASKTFVKNKITEWATFKDVYFKNGKLNTKYYTKFIELVNNIFPLPVNTDIDDDLIYMIRTIYGSPLNNIYNGIDKMIAHQKPLKYTMRHLFMTWKVFIENLVEVFVSQRNKYIDKHKLSDTKNNFIELVNRWYDIDAENNLGMTSTILFFNFPRKDVTLDITIPKIHWSIKKDSKANASVKKSLDKINESIKKFLNKIEKNDFAYYGWCSMVPIKRFKLLLTFPVDELMNVINTFTDEYKDMFNDTNSITNRVEKLSKKMCMCNRKADITFTKAKVSDKGETLRSKDDKVHLFVKYIDAYLDIYKKMLPFLVKKEKLVCDISLDINIISNDIQKIINAISKVFKRPVSFLTHV